MKCFPPCSYPVNNNNLQQPNNRVASLYFENIGTSLPSRRLHVRDRQSGMLFLVYTGSDVSLIPAPTNPKCKPSDVLFAANDSRIATFGERRLTFDLGLKRSFPWNFYVAALPSPIIGADLLAHFGLTVDLGRRCLLD